MRAFGVRVADQGEVDGGVRHEVDEPHDDHRHRDETEILRREQADQNDRADETDQAREPAHGEGQDRAAHDRAADAFAFRLVSASVAQIGHYFAPGVPVITRSMKGTSLVIATGPFATGPRLRYTTSSFSC